MPALIDYKYRGKSGSWKVIQWEVGMAGPLKVILPLAAVCSGLYAFGFIRNFIYTGQFSIDKFLWIFGSFIGVTVSGLLIWGLVILVQKAARRKSPGRINERSTHVSTTQ